MKIAIILLSVLIVLSVMALSLSTDQHYYLPVSFTYMLKSVAEVDFNFKTIKDYFTSTYDIINNENSVQDNINGSTLNDSLNYFNGSASSYTDPISATVGLFYGIFLEGWEFIFPTEEITEGAVAVAGFPIALLIDTTLIATDAIDCILKLCAVEEAPDDWKPATEYTDDWFDKKYNIPSVTP